MFTTRRGLRVNLCFLLDAWRRAWVFHPDARQCLTPSRPRSVLVAALCVIGFAVGTGAHAQATPQEREALAPSWLPLLQQSAPPVAGERGQWVAWSTNYAHPTAARNVGLTDADVRAWDANLRRLLEALQAAPVLRDLNGFSAGGRASLDGEWQGAGARPRKAPAVGSLWIGTWRPEVAARDAAMNRAVDSDTRRFLMGLNIIPYGPRAPWMHDAQGEFFVLPQLPSPWPGTMIVRRSLLVVRPDKPPPYLPVSQGRVLQAFAAHFADGEAQAAQVLAMRRQALADYLSPANEARRRAEIETETRRFMNANRMDEASARRRAEAIDQAYVEKLRAEANPPADDPVFGPALAARAARERLASMSPAERDAPAWMSAAPDRVENPFALPLRAPGEPGAAPVMQVNPAFFDPRLPRTALQALTVHDLDGIAEYAHLDPGRARYGPARVNLLILQQTDWQALARQVLR